MAKVTLVIEDMEKEGKPSLRMSIKSDNNNHDETTLAEEIASALFQSVTDGAAGVTYVSGDSNSDNESLN